jgi:hypothetical protein
MISYNGFYSQDLGEAALR